MPEEKRKEEDHTYTPQEANPGKRNFRIGFLAGAAAGAVLTAALMKACTGYSAGVSDQHGDAGVTDVSDAGAYDAGVPKNKDSTDKDPCYESLQAKLNKCYEDLGKQKGLLEACNTNLEACIEERDELRKRPRSCPTYKPKACPPVMECPQLPYIRRGK